MVASGGAKFRIFLADGVPNMQYKDKSNNLKSIHPAPVLQYCCDTFLNDKCPFVLGFTENNRECGESVYKFCAHPSYYGESGQRCNVWYDWADFLYKTEDDGDTGVIITPHAPAQIVCFLNLGPDNTPINSDPLEQGFYAVVRSFEKPATPVPPSRIIFEGSLENSFYLYSCDAINGTVAVVPNVISRGNDDIDITTVTIAQGFFLSKTEITG